MSGLDVVGVGALNLDRIYAVPRFAAPGEEVRVLSKTTAPGGSAANTIAALARMGLKAGFIGILGRDVAGDYILKDFSREGVDTRGLMFAEGSTGEVTALVDREGERTLYAYPGINDSLRMGEASLGYARQAKFLHMSSFVGGGSYGAQQEIIARLKKTKISFAPGMLYASMGLEALRPVIEKSEAVFMNREELRIMTKAGLEEGSARVIDTGASTVAITLGGRGCYIRSRDEEARVEGYPAEVVDTTGAGDAFAAGFLYGMLADLPLSRCGMLGNKLASMCIAEIGARAGLPTLEMLEGFISSLR